MNKSTHSILAALKTKTGILHEQLESHLDILNPAFELADYQSLLEKFYGFYRPVEKDLDSLKAYESLDLDPAARWKTPRLAADLTALGVDLEKLPDCADLPEISTPWQAYGCIYVLEGATLGGQIIRRHLSKRPDWPELAGLSFFDSYQNEVGPMWKSFCVRLDHTFKRALLTSPAAEVEAAIVDSANQTFLKLDAWLNDRNK